MRARSDNNNIIFLYAVRTKLRNATTTSAMYFYIIIVFHYHDIVFVCSPNSKNILMTTSNVDTVNVVAVSHNIIIILNNIGVMGI